MPSTAAGLEASKDLDVEEVLNQMLTSNEFIGKEVRWRPSEALRVPRHRLVLARQG